MSTHHYFSYLIRIWQDDDLPQGEPLASLEDPTTQQLTYFTSMEELFAFLRVQSRTGNGKTLPHDNAREGKHHPLDD